MMQVNTYRLLSDKIEEGIRGGLNKCFKREYLTYNDVSIKHEEAAIDEIHHYIMLAISEYFDWEDESDEE
jgi:hypothetical protein